MTQRPSKKARERLSAFEEYLLEQDERERDVAELKAAKCRTEASLQEISKELSSLREAVSSLQEEVLQVARETLARASEERAGLTREFVSTQIVEPFCLALLPALDFASECARTCSAQPDTAEKFSALASLLTQVLESQGAEKLPEHADLRFDATFMHPVSVELTPHARLDQSVSVLAPGFKRNGRVLRQQRVSVSRYEGAASA